MRGTKSDSCGRKFFSLSSVSCESYNQGEGRAEILRAWGLGALGGGFEKEGGGGELNLCAETII